MRLAKTILWVALIAVSILPLIVFHPLLDTYGFGRMMLLRLLMALVLPVLLIIWQVSPESRPKATPFLIAAFAYNFGAIVSAVFGADWLYSLTSNAERVGGLLTFWTLGILFFATRTLFIQRDDKNWQTLWIAQVLVGFLVCLLAVLNAYAENALKNTYVFGQLIGTMANPAFLAEYMLLLVIFAAMLAGGAVGRLRFLFTAAAIVFTAVIFWTQIRGAIFGSAVFAAIFVFFIRRDLKGWIKTHVPALLLLAAVFVLVLAVPLFSGQLTKLKLNDWRPDASASQRLIVWSVALPALRDRPLLGWGMENFFSAFYSHTPPALLKYTTEVFDRAHNEIAEQLAAGGIIGFVLFAGFVIAALHQAFDSWRRALSSNARITAGAVFAGFIGYGASLLFLFETPGAIILLTFLLAYSDAIFAKSAALSIVDFGRRSKNFICTSSAVIAVILLVFGAFFPALASALAKKGGDDFLENPGATLYRYQSAFFLNTYLNKEIGKDLILRLIAVRNQPDIALKSWLEGAELAERAAIGVRDRHRWDPSPFLMLSALNEAHSRRAPEYLGPTESALLSAISRAPFNVEAYYTLTLTRIKRWDYPGALEALKQAEILAPEEPSIEKYRGLAAGLSGDREAMRQAFQKYVESASSAGRQIEVERYESELERVPIMHPVPDI